MQYEVKAYLLPPGQVCEKCGREGQPTYIYACLHSAVCYCQPCLETLVAEGNRALCEQKYELVLSEEENYVL